MTGNSTTRSGEGGGLSNYGTAHVSGSSVVDNSAAFGAGLYTRGTLTVSNSTLSGNVATGLAGGIYVFWTGSATVYNSTLSNNSAITGGAVLNNGGTINSNNCIIANSPKGSNCYGEIGGTNTLTDDGSCGSATTQSDSINLADLADNGCATQHATLTGLACVQTHALLTGSEAIDAGDNTIGAADPVNGVDQRGFARDAACDIGAVEACSTFPLNAATETEFKAAIQCYNEAPVGVYEINVTNSFTLTTSPISINNPNMATLTINGSSNTIDGADSFRPIEVLASTVTIDNIILQNGAGNTGGAVFIDTGADVTITNSTVMGSTSSSGGGIRNDGTLAISNSLLTGNSTTRSGEGGGLSNYGTAHVSGSTVVDNSGTFGAGLYTRGTLTVSNSTLSGNVATGLAGGIYVFWTGSAAVYNSTLSNNSAITGGAVLNNGGTFNSHNSIIANSPKGSNCYGAIGGTNTLTDDDSCGSATTQSDSINLADLADNGCATQHTTPTGLACGQTHALLTGSEAIGAGDNTICAADPVNGLDQRGFERDATCDIGAFEVQNSAPNITSNTSASVEENQTTAIDVQATDDNDAEGAGLSFSLSGGADQSLFNIDAGMGVVTFNNAPDFENPADSGGDNNYDLQVTVTDSGDLTAVKDIVISVTDVAENTAPELSAINNQVVDEGQLLEFTVSATDAEGDNLTFSLGDAPTGASLIDNGDGTATFSWTPDFVQAGNYPDVLITVTDDGDPMLSDFKTFNITVGDINRPPQFDTTDSQTTDEGVELSFTVTATDPDGNAITLTMANEPTGASFTDNGDGTGIFIWPPEFDQDGNFTVQFTATDDGSPVGSDTLDVIITVGNVNRAPELNPVGDRTLAEGEMLEITLIASDPDSDNISYTVSNEPAGAALADNGDGTATFSWTPGFDQAGNYMNVQFTVTDDGDPKQSDAETITITVGDENRPPALSSIGDQTVAEGETLELTLTASDPDGDNLSYPEPVDLPLGALFIDNGDGTATFSWIPEFDQADNYEVEFSVVDDGSPAEEDFEVVMISVGEVNRPPVLDPIGDHEIDEGELLEFTLTASDPDGDMLTYQADGLPVDAEFIDNGDGTATFSWEPDDDHIDSYDVTFTVADNGIPTETDVEVIIITVNAIQVPPFASCGGFEVFETEPGVYEAPDFDGAVIVGINRKEKIVGTNGPDLILGLGGNDRIFGKKGDDVICGGPGKDNIAGGRGNDVIYGDRGNDVLKGNPGDDLLHGGDGRDRCFGGPGQDTLEVCE